jgi:16S rRNA (guanine527-N7)-methyltransferase
LPDPAATQLIELLRAVVDDPLAPTTVRGAREVLNDHLSDSLVALDIEAVRPARIVADLGAGAGFPGLPLAIALPRAQVALVESNSRKCAFIARAADRCRIANADAVHSRAEEWRAGLGRCELVTARALAPLAVVLEYAAPLMAVGGALIAWRGRRDPEAEAAARSAAEILGLVETEVRVVEPYRGVEHRHLHVFSKVSATPDRFPRRPGVARKRPLGAASDRLRR